MFFGEVTRKTLGCNKTQNCGGTNVVRCAIWYRLYNLKNVKNTHGRKLILVKLVPNGTKSGNASQISYFQEIIG